METKVVLFWAVCAGVAAARVAFSLGEAAPQMGACLKHAARGIGVISEEPSITETGQTLVVRVESMTPLESAFSLGPLSGEPCPRGLSIRMKTKLYPRFYYGETVSFAGTTSTPFNFKSSTGRTFDYQGYLAKDDIFYEMRSATVEAHHDIDTMEGESGSLLSRLTGRAGRAYELLVSSLYMVKRGFVDNLDAVLGEPHAALAAGLVVGEKSALGNGLLADFRAVGLIHIVVLSGFNITVVAHAMRKLLSPLPRAYGIWIGGAGVIVFGILVGGGATVVRSCLMASIALMGSLIRRDYDVARALVFAGLAMVIQNPLILLHDPSFQLSFLATMGLVFLASPLEKLLWFVPERFGMRDICSATCATQIFVSPFIAYTMGTVSIVGLVTNLLVLPFIPLTMLAVFLAGSSGSISLPVSQFFGWIAHFFLSYELHVVRIFASVPFAAIALPQFSGWWVAAFYAVFFATYAYVAYKRKKRSPDPFSGDL